MEYRTLKDSVTLQQLLLLGLRILDIFIHKFILIQHGFLGVDLIEEGD